MSVINQELNSCIKNFIELLQESKPDKSRSRRASCESQRLSTIYSASEPEFSQSDKCSGHQSHCDLEPYQIIKQLQSVIWQLKKCKNPVKEIQRGLQKAQSIILQLLRVTEQQKSKEINIVNQKKQEQILKAIQSMSRAEKQLWENYERVADFNEKLKKENQVLRQLNQNLTIQIRESQNDVDFMKKLVLIANQNYEKLQKKCIKLENQSKLYENLKQQDNYVRPLTARNSTIVKKSEFSPRISSNSKVRKSISPRNQKYVKNLKTQKGALRPVVQNRQIR